MLLTVTKQECLTQTHDNRKQNRDTKNGLTAPETEYGSVTVCLQNNYRNVNHATMYTWHILNDTRAITLQTH